MLLKQGALIIIKNMKKKTIKKFAIKLHYKELISTVSYKYIFS